MTSNQVFAELRRRGATRAEVSFSGGNDEGGADSITLYKGDQEVADIPLSYARESTGDSFGEALEQPIYDHWGGFAGDFSVSGTLMWDADSSKVLLSYDETEYVHHEERL